MNNYFELPIGMGTRLSGDVCVCIKFNFFFFELTCLMFTVGFPDLRYYRVHNRRVFLFGLYGVLLIFGVITRRTYLIMIELIIVLTGCNDLTGVNFL